MIFRYAFISDIHANSLALAAVLEDIAKRGLKTVYNLGDSLFGPLDVHGTFELLAGHDLVHLKGNGDRELLKPDDGSANTINRVRRALTAAEKDWLKKLPANIRTDHFLLIHGSPRSDEDYLLEGLNEAGAYLKSPAELTGSLAGISAPAIVCGHSHLARVVKLPHGPLIINAGSVGLPAYKDDLPVPHKMESMSPHAKYVILEIGAGYHVEIINVPYDWAGAAAQARAQGRPDWAQYLEDGFVRD